MATTSSSNTELSSKTITIFLRPLISTSFVSIPTKETIRVALGGTIIENSPEALVIVPLSIPFTDIETPGNSTPVWSCTTPETFISSELILFA